MSLLFIKEKKFRVVTLFSLIAVIVTISVALFLIKSKVNDSKQNTQNSPSVAPQPAALVQEPVWQ